MKNRQLWLCLLIFTVGGCGSQQRITTTAGAELPLAGHFLTWTNYDGSGREQEEDNAVYWLDGQRVGRGRDGAKRVLEFFKERPKDHRVIVTVAYRTSADPPHMWYTPPCVGVLNEMVERGYYLHWFPKRP